MSTSDEQIKRPEKALNEKSTEREKPIVAVEKSKDTIPPPKDGPAASTDATATLKMYVDIVNSEKQAIWARHATMVVGNSLILNAIKQVKLEETLENTYRFFNFMGLLLCIVWLAIVCFGWRRCYQFMMDAKKLPACGAPNPFNEFPKFEYWILDPIFICAICVVAIFASMYAFGLYPFCR